MKIKVGDVVKMKYFGLAFENNASPAYTVLEIEEDERYFKAKHPEIGGYFGFAVESIDYILNEDGDWVFFYGGEK